ncbi:hypothetical protein EmuJ_000560700 [Echinococcus multilocularis]|uniref:Uncharacterized protein n=2 Tax=Echinococcus multilocularis TaxID=6211 RepID=A0A068Y0L4_ECHMU|nr:hypothetical protein EmuJ_000560700 [Echinococcus multilocularis]
MLSWKRHAEDFISAWRKSLAMGKNPSGLVSKYILARPKPTKDKVGHKTLLCDYLETSYFFTHFTSFPPVHLLAVGHPLSTHMYAIHSTKLLITQTNADSRIGSSNETRLDED